MAANYPTNDPSNGSLLIAANNVSSTLNGGINAAAVAATLASTVNFPASGGITIESEAILYTANNTAGSVLSGFTRGADSTTAAVHADGTAVYMNMQARHHNQLKDEIIAMGADLRNVFKADLDDINYVPQATRTNLAERIYELAYQIKLLGNSADWKTVYPSKFLDATTASLNASTQTTSITFVSTGLAVTVNMQTTTARAMIHMGVGRARTDTGSVSSIDVTILRGATNLGGASIGLARSFTPTGIDRIETTMAIPLLDSPGTNGSVTYTAHFKSLTTAATATFGTGETNSSRIIVEIIAA